MPLSVEGGIPSRAGPCQNCLRCKKQDSRMDALRERARIVVEYSHSLPTRYRRWQSIVQHFSTYLREWYGRSHATSSECKGLRAISNLMIITSKIRHGHMGYISSQENRKPSESECREKRKPKGIRVSNAKGRSAESIRIKTGEGLVDSWDYARRLYQTQVS